MRNGFLLQTDCLTDKTIMYLYCICNYKEFVFISKVPWSQGKSLKILIKIFYL